jgi:hypothetical protein
MQSKTHEADNPLPASEIGSPQDDPDRCVRVANAVVATAERRLFESLISLHTTMGFWASDLTSDLDAYACFLEARASEIRTAGKTIHSLISMTDMDIVV